MRTTRIFGLFCGISLIAACSATPGEEAASSQGAAVSSRTPGFVTIASDADGGYDVTYVNAPSWPTHVASLDFSQTGLDPATVEALEALPATELVLEGKIASNALVVTTAYRGMPGVTFDASATFYQASDGVARELNESATRPLASVDVTAASKAFVQQSWLQAEVAKGAIVAGAVAERGGVLTADQVFLALPVAIGPCVITSHVCPDATPVATYTRDASLCLDFTGCEAHALCPMYVPVCGQGYELVSWTSAPNACPMFACDPAFIH
jgi:hypothetical protein